MTTRVAQSPAGEAEQLEEVAVLLKCAGDPIRLAVLYTLEGGERNVGEIQRALALPSQPALSHHLALLRAHRIVRYRRIGKSNYYNLTEVGAVIVRLVSEMKLS